MFHDIISIASLIIYLLDSVTGGVVYRSVHKHASEPVGILLCENWIIVSHSSRM